MLTTSGSTMIQNGLNFDLEGYTRSTEPSHKLKMEIDGTTLSSRTNALKRVEELFSCCC